MKMCLIKCRSFCRLGCGAFFSSMRLNTVNPFKSYQTSNEPMILIGYVSWSQCQIANKNTEQLARQPASVNASAPPCNLIGQPLKRFYKVGPVLDASLFVYLFN